MSTQAIFFIVLISMVFGAMVCCAVLEVIVKKNTEVRKKVEAAGNAGNTIIYDFFALPQSKTRRQNTRSERVTYCSSSRENSSIRR